MTFFVRVPIKTGNCIFVALIYYMHVSNTVSDRKGFSVDTTRGQGIIRAVLVVHVAAKFF